MAGSVNKVVLIGNLGGDPEVRFTPGGQAVANFNIATSESWTNKEGNREERTEWHRIVVWGKLAELCGEFLAKGRKVYVEGRLQTRSYDKDGVTRYVTEIKAQDIQFLDGGGEGRPANAEAGSAPAPQRSAPPEGRAPSSSMGGGRPQSSGGGAPQQRSAPPGRSGGGAPANRGGGRSQEPPPDFGSPNYASDGDDDDIPF